MLTGECLCADCAWTFEGLPETATACNCTACRRYGALWIYGWVGEGVSLSGPVQGFMRGDRDLAFLFCPTCGCLMAWRGTAQYSARQAGGRTRIAVNVRMAPPEAVAALPIRHFDGFGRFEELPEDGRRVADYWV